MNSSGRNIQKHRYFSQKSDIFLSDSALRTDGVGRSDDGASGLQRGDDAGFGDGDALLLHGLVDARPVCVVHLQDESAVRRFSAVGTFMIQEEDSEGLRSSHLIELIDQTHPAVGQHQRSGLQRPLAADWVSLDVSGQTDGGGSLTRGEHGAARHLLHVPAEKTDRHIRLLEEKPISQIAEIVL